MLQSNINEELWEINEEFKYKTDKTKDSIQYISALIYIKYYKTSLNNDFIKLYNERDSYYLTEKIDEIINSIQINKEDKYLFSNIKFKDIIFYRNLGEKNILSKTIEKIQKLTEKEITKYEIANAYDYVLKRAINRGDIIRENGEFYTPLEITDMMASLVIEKENADVYDPMCGSGNFLISSVDYLNAKVFGEEENLRYYNICKTKMLLNSIIDKDVLYKNDEKVLLKQTNKKYDYILANPPFSEKNWDEKIENKKIFKEYGLTKTAVGDYAYVLEMLGDLKEDGTMAVILPHGVLFRESEKRVREQLVKKNNIKAIIGLPENLFYNTRMSVVILILSKNIKKDTILFIDASNEYITTKRNNILSKENQNSILEAYTSYKEIEGFSHIATKQEIEKNDYNLTIKKYVVKKKLKKSIEKQKILKKLQDLANEQDILEANIKDVLNVLGVKENFSSQKNIVDLTENQDEEDSKFYKIDYKVIGGNIRRERIRKNYTQEMMAESLGISTKYISRVECGMGGLRLQTIADICNVLDIKIDTLLKDK